jgi:hypothetical protein
VIDVVRARARPCRGVCALHDLCRTQDEARDELRRKVTDQGADVSEKQKQRKCWEAAAAYHADEKKCPSRAP